MSRAIWRGDVSFGLVTIPVEIHPAVETRDLAFHLLDGRTMTPVKQRRVNAETGEEIAWEDIVKGYQTDDGSYVVVTDDDFRAANVDATRTIDIIAMVRAEEIPSALFDKPYYLAPATKAARKAYAILRDTLEKSEYVALAYVVIRTRQHVAAVTPSGDALVLEMMRFPYEIRTPEDLDLPGRDMDSLGVAPKELEMADQLVGAMVEQWDPGKLQDSYRDDLLALIKRKVETGEVTSVPESPPAPEETGEVIDMMALLKRSVEEARSAKRA
jgi:DNA end-binding protein Ku